jgi:hypothetical protein
MQRRPQWQRGTGYEMASARSNTGVVGLSPTRSMDVCVCSVYVCVVLCVQADALRGTDPPSSESYHV